MHTTAPATQKSWKVAHTCTHGTALDAFQKTDRRSYKSTAREMATANGQSSKRNRMVDGNELCCQRGFRIVSDVVNGTRRCASPLLHAASPPEENLEAKRIVHQMASHLVLRVGASALFLSRFLALFCLCQRTCSYHPVNCWHYGFIEDSCTMRTDSKGTDVLSFVCFNGGPRRNSTVVLTCTAFLHVQ